jgi:hypothetical protein
MMEGYAEDPCSNVENGVLNNLHISIEKSGKGVGGHEGDARRKEVKGRGTLG